MVTPASPSPNSPRWYSAIVFVSPAKKYGGSGSKIKMSKSLSVSSEINLIGKTTDEALALLDKYLDDAYIAHLGRRDIVV